MSHVDSLNTQAYLCRYVRPDSALQLARQAARLSAAYPDGYAEALNHQMFVAFLRLDYEGCVRLYERLDSSTGNQIELLAGDVNMMRICQQTAQNRLFFDYYNRANERIRRIYEEIDEVQGRTRERLFYAETEFHLVCASNYQRLMQEQNACSELAMVDEDGYIRKDKAMLAFYYYLNGMACLNMTLEDETILTDAFGYLLRAYSLANRYDYAYFRSLAGLALADMFIRRGGYAAVESRRKGELNYMYSLLTHAADSSQVAAPPASLFSETLARESLSEAQRCRFLLVEIEAYRVLGDVMLQQGEYYRALNYYETVLSCLNLHHRTYYPDDKGERLKPYGDSGMQSVDMLWTKLPDTQTLPNSLAAIRERLSLAYSALNDKQKSDYNRNLYLDLLDFTRQDKLLESRVYLVEQDNRLLNMLLTFLLLFTFVLTVTVLFYARKWEKRRVKQQVLLNDISKWFMDVAFTKSGHQLEQTLEVYPWMKRENRILRKVLRPYMDWAEKNRMVSDSLKEEQLQLHEDFLRSERQISRNKRENIQKRAKVSLVHSIMPFIDRILYTLRRMERTETCDRNALGYVEELAEQIEHYNKVLAGWIMNDRGEPDLAVESFPLQELFLLLEKRRYGFQKKGVQLDILPTGAWVKADKGLTFFMLNTLADNARKFTSPGGRVTIQAQELDNAVEVAVSDTGCGLSAEDVELILSSKIYDAGRIGGDTPASRQGKGSGFGLLNCKGIVEKYKKSSELFSVCRFHVESEVGKGSRFSFRLPKGIVRTVSVLLLSILPIGRIHADGFADTGLLTKAALYADSVYFANIDGDYERSMALGDSTLRYISLYYRRVLPPECMNKQLAVDGGGAGEQEWWALGVKADYHLIMGLRNELAVAALALHRWDVYEYNNIQFTHLYRLLTKDDSVEIIYTQQRAIQTNLSVGIALLVVVTFLFIITFYIIYFRRRILFRINAIQVLEVNRAMLGVMNRYDGTEQIDNWMPQLLAVVLGGIRELHEVDGISILLRKTDGSRIGVFSQGQIPHDLVTDTLLQQACDQGNTVSDRVSDTRSYALLLNVNGEEKVCIGALALHYATGKMQPEDLLFEGYIVTYLSIQLYETIIRRGAYRDSVEMAENDKQRALYEATRLRVQNQILDNCLSVIKHESMYYPSRIRQIIRTMGHGMTACEWKERLTSLRDVAEFYREIYVLLCAQADRQIETGYFRCEALSVRRVANQWLKRQQRGGRVRLSVTFVREVEGCVNGDCDLLDFMLELIGGEWARLLETREACGEQELTLEVAEEDGFFRFAFCTPALLYTEAESRDLFQPDPSRYVYLLCKEIVREQDKLNNFCGCRINMESIPGKGCRIWFTLPEIKEEAKTWNILK